MLDRYIKKTKWKKSKTFDLTQFYHLSQKMSEKFIQESTTLFVDKFLSEFISAYGKAYSTNHVLLRLIEQ